MAAHDADQASDWLKNAQDDSWIKMQTKTFTKWCNMKAGANMGGEKLTQLDKDFEDGVKFCKFVEAITHEKLFGKVKPDPKMRIHKVGNVTVGLDLLKHAVEKQTVEREKRTGRKDPDKTKLDISSENIADGNMKLILGMIWYIIQKYDISDISEEDSGSKDALLLWCQKKTKGYHDVDVKNMGVSWKDGLAFCALIHKHRPDLINFESLNKDNPAHNLELAFKTAEEQFGIPRFLEVEDMVESAKPDERSVMTYVMQYYKYFNSSSKGDIASRRVGKALEFASAMEKLQQDYEAAADAWAQWVMSKTEWLNSINTGDTLEAVQEASNLINTYRATDKPPKAEEKLNLEAQLNALQMKLRQGNRNPYVPKTTVEDMNELWRALEEAERLRLAALADDLARQEKIQSLLKLFNQKADALEKWDAKKEAYLRTEEEVDSLNTAQNKIKNLRAYDDEYKTSLDRLKVVQDLGAQIIALGYKEKDQVAARCDALDNKSKELLTLAAAKDKVLQEALERERRKDELRKEFARQAKDLNKWIKDNTVAVASTRFGNDLQSVEAFKQTLDKSNADLDQDGNRKIDALKALDAELKALGATDNKYTVLTVDDCVKTKSLLDGAVAKRNADYDDELARQREMEKKRLEFAEACKAFVAFVEQQKKDIDALSGEPDAVESGIASVYQNGAPVATELEKVAKVDAEARALRITSNPHTTHDLPQLRAMQTEQRIAVQNYLYELANEKRLKRDYETKAKELVDWITATIPKLRDLSALDNATLETARAAVAAFNQYRLHEKGDKAALKAQVEVLLANVENALKASSHARPIFTAPAGLSVAEINTLWAQLKEAEDARDAALQAELQRLETLQRLLRRLTAEHGELDAWVGRQEEYLKREETITTLTAAQVQLTVLEAFKAEYEKQRARVTQMEGTLHQIKDLKHSDPAVDEMVAAVVARYNGLKMLVDAKEAKLKQELAGQNEKEEARKAFAQAASDLNRWARDAADTVSQTHFGDNLQAVEKFGGQLDSDDATLNDKAAAMHQRVLDAAAKLTALGVTDNRHTSSTPEDAARDVEGLKAQIAKRREAYGNELARQRGMEAKRIEFAEACKTFMALIASTRSQVDALTGEPDAVEAGIVSTYQNGTPVAAELDKVARIDSEAKSLGITSNPHTDLDLAKLRVAQTELRIHVDNFVYELQGEQRLKREYTEKAAVITEWINVTVPRLQGESDTSTLEAARVAVAEFNNYRMNEKGEKAALKAEVDALHDAITKVLQASKATRPAFAPAHTTASIDGLWTKLAETEKAKDQALQAALTRQEQLAAERRRLDNDVSELTAWVDVQETYLQQKEAVDSVTAAEVQVVILEAFKGDYGKQHARKENILKICAAIKALDANDTTGDAASGPVLARFDGLKALADAKAADLEEGRKAQKEKEDARLAFAKAASDFVRWSRDSCDTIAQYKFGVSRDEVLKYAGELDADTGRVTERANALEADVNAAVANMQRLGVTDNPHSTLTPEDVTRERTGVTDELTRRRAAYDAEVASQNAMEAKREEFARVGNAFAEWLAGQHAAVDAVSSGSVDERIAKINDVYKDGAPANAEFEKVAAVDREATAMGITENKHAAQTMDDLIAANKRFNTVVQNALNSLNEEKQMEARTAQQEAEWAEKDRLETVKIEYAGEAQALTLYYDTVAQNVTDDLSLLDTVEAVEEQRARYEESNAARAENEARYNKMAQLAASMTAGGITDFAGLPIEAAKTQHDTLMAALDARPGQLTEALEKQRAHAALRKTFLDAAADLHAACAALKEAVNKDSTGTDEAQLGDAKAIMAQLEAASGTKMPDVAAKHKAVLDAGISARASHDMTPESLQRTLQQLTGIQTKKISALEGQIAAKQHSGVTPEQLQEFKEVFAFFDKEKKGWLKPPQLRSCLQSLGDEFEDAKFEAVVADLDKEKTGQIQFTPFLNFMVNRNTDQDSKDQIVEAFTTMVNGAPVITEEQMARVFPAEQVAYLKRVIPKVEGGYDYRAWAAASFSK